MWATVEVDQEIIQFINNIQNYTETFEEIQEIAFSKNMINKKYTIVEKFNYTLMFQEIKKSAITKVMNKKRLNLPEGIIFERMLNKYTDGYLIPLDDYLKLIFKNSTVIKNYKFKNVFQFIKGVRS